MTEHISVALLSLGIVGAPLSIIFGSQQMIYLAICAGFVFFGLFLGNHWKSPAALGLVSL